VRDALEHGIALIHQELNLAPNLDLGANIFLGREPLRRLLIDRDRIQRESARYLEMVGLDLAPSCLVGSLSIGQQQLVEIAKALAVDARILIMDEPTSSLSQHETLRLFEVIRDLKDRGVSIIYISHRLGEVLNLADRVEVLRDGENAGRLEGEEISHDRMVRLMVGRNISQFYHHLDRQPGEPLLKVEVLCTDAHPKKPLSFQVRGGEIVGVAGLVGAGRTGVLQTLFGIVSPHSGRIEVAGKPLRPGRPRDAIRAGIALVPEDRKKQALILDMALRVNLSLARLRRDQRFGFLDMRREADLVEQAIERLRIRSQGPEQFVRYLSGGNQQKVVLGRWLAMDPSVLLLDEPTRGVDVGSKEEIYGLIEQLAARGVAVLFVSSEMEEILGLSDRVLVMHQGSISGELSRDELSEKRVMELATGIT
jgi:ribose transport system ATP-binding protein